jgi:hypothetical protein
MLFSSHPHPQALIMYYPRHPFDRRIPILTPPPPPPIWSIYLSLASENRTLVSDANANLARAEQHVARTIDAEKAHYSRHEWPLPGWLKEQFRKKFAEIKSISDAVQSIGNDLVALEGEARVAAARGRSPYRTALDRPVRHALLDLNLVECQMHLQRLLETETERVSDLLRGLEI